MPGCVGMVPAVSWVWAQWHVPGTGGQLRALSLTSTSASGSARGKADPLGAPDAEARSGAEVGVGRSAQSRCGSRFSPRALAPAGSGLSRPTPSLIVACLTHSSPPAQLQPNLSKAAAPAQALLGSILDIAMIHLVATGRAAAPRSRLMSEQRP